MKYTCSKCHVDYEYKHVTKSGQDPFCPHKMLKKLDSDSVNHPPHYIGHPSGVECIQITEWMSFNLGNAMKYLWRADLKFNAIEDMRKAVWYIEREIARREKGGEDK